MIHMLLESKHRKLDLTENLMLSVIQDKLLK